MAKLRRNHAPRGGAAAGSTILKVTLFALILLGLIWAFRQWNAARRDSTAGPSPYAGAAHYLPTGGDGELVDHGGFALDYAENWEQAAWVAYILNGDDLRGAWTERRNNFRSDPLVSTRSASDNDYRGSGYDRGHLAPFADFAWNAELADATFYMSNISPQDRAFNQGIWRELEELTRDWAKRDGRLYVVTGPVRSRPPLGYIGREEQVAVPAAFFKVLLDLEEPAQKGIGFVIPNAASDRPLTEYMVSIDSVESVTGLNFFPELMPADLEARIEAAARPGDWPLDRHKYDRRVDQWNNVK